MTELKEIPAGYASPAQKNLLAALSRDPILGEAFFLTGGTALSVFYLGHRVSDDIDLFTSEPMDLPAITDLILRPWNEEIVPIVAEPSFVSVLIRNVKVDFVVDHLADMEIRPMAAFDSGGRLAVDSLEAIAGNKLATLISRLEPKDYLDVYFIKEEYPRLINNDVFQRAKRKDAVFDDPRSAAMHLKEGFRIIQRSIPKSPGIGVDGHPNPGLIPFPRLVKPVDWDAFEKVFLELAEWLGTR